MVNKKDIDKKIIELDIKKTFDGYCSTFKIGVQTFSLKEVETKREAKWYCEMLEHVFSNLAEPYGFGLTKSEANKKVLKEMANPKIEIKYKYKK